MLKAMRRVEIFKKLTDFLSQIHSKQILKFFPKKRQISSSNHNGAKNHFKRTFGPLQRPQRRFCSIITGDNQVPPIS
jgi:hypothetical protein